MKKIIAITLGLTILASQAYAELPVIDFTEIARTGEMLSQLSKQYTTLQSQYSTMKQQYSTMTGNYQWGNYQNSDSDLQGREWAPGDWKSALSGEAGGNTSRYQELLSQYKQNHQSMSQSSFAKGSDQALSTSYNNQVETTQASAAAATYEFNDINKHLKNLQALGQQIETSANKNTKSAIDLNSRIELEVAYISIEEVRMQAVINQQQAQASATDIASENEASTYNQAGANP